MDYLILFFLVSGATAIKELKVSKKIMLLIALGFAFLMFIIESIIIKKTNYVYLFVNIFVVFGLLGIDYLIKNHGNKKISSIFKKEEQ